MGSNSFGHNYTRPQSKPSDDEIEDPLEIMLNKTGCKELHFQLQVITSFLLFYNYFYSY